MPRESASKYENGPSFAVRIPIDALQVTGKF